MRKLNPFAFKTSPEDLSLKESGKMIGGYLPMELAEYLSVYAIHENESISSVLRAILEKWLVGKPDKSMLLDNLISRAYGEWYRRSTENQLNNFPVQKWSDYLKEVVTRLKKRKVSLVDIGLIEKELNRRYEENEPPRSNNQKKKTSNKRTGERKRKK